MCDRIVRKSVVGAVWQSPVPRDRERGRGPGTAPQPQSASAFGPLGYVPNAATGNPELRLAATSWNSGQGPLELVAGPCGQAGQDVYQRIYTQGGGFTDNLAGTFIFHEHTIIFTSSDTPSIC